MAGGKQNASVACSYTLSFKSFYCSQVVRTYLVGIRGSNEGLIQSNWKLVNIGPHTKDGDQVFLHTYAVWSGA